MFMALRINDLTQYGNGTVATPTHSMAMKLLRIDPKRGQDKPVDALDEIVIRNNVQEFYIHRHQLPTLNNLLSVLKTDIMSTIHQNSTRNNMIITQKVYKFKNDA